MLMMCDIADTYAAKVRIYTKMLGILDGQGTIDAVKDFCLTIRQKCENYEKLPEDLVYFPENREPIHAAVCSILDAIEHGDNVEVIRARVQERSDAAKTMMHKWDNETWRMNALLSLLDGKLISLVVTNKEGKYLVENEELAETFTTFCRTAARYCARVATDHESPEDMAKDMAANAYADILTVREYDVHYIDDVAEFRLREKLHKAADGTIFFPPDRKFFVDGHELSALPPELV